jgi:hypothetical protein
LSLFCLSWFCSWRISETFSWRLCTSQRRSPTSSRDVVWRLFVCTIVAFLVDKVSCRSETPVCRTVWRPTVPEEPLFWPTTCRTAVTFPATFRDTSIECCCDIWCDWWGLKGSCIAQKVFRKLRSFEALTNCRVPNVGGCDDPKVTSCTWEKIRVAAVELSGNSGHSFDAFCKSREERLLRFPTEPDRNWLS